MPKTWVAAPGSKCQTLTPDGQKCGSEGPIVHHCDGMEGLHCMLCHDAWRMSQITEALGDLANQDYSVEGLEGGNKREE